MKILDPVLAGLRVMVVEDQYAIAAEMHRLLEVLGVDVVGPFSGIEQAMVAARQDLDLALLDVNLQGIGVFPLAAELTRLGIPFAFVTAYGSSLLPPVYRSIPRVEKPVSQAALMTMLPTLASARVARST